MCGIAGLFSKSLDVSEGLGSHLGDMLLQLSDRGPDSAGVAVYRDPAPSGSSKVSLFSPDPEQDWGAVRDALDEAFGAGEPEPRGSHAVIVVETDAAEAQAWLHERYPELRVMSAGQAIEIFKEAGPPREFIESFGLAGMSGLARPRPHADGDREPRDDRALASVLDRARPLPRPQRVAVEPQPAAPAAARRGHRVPDRQRLRGGGGLPDLAAARGRVAGAGARGLPRGPRRLLHVRGRDDRRLRGAARPDRLQAGGDGGDRRLGRDGVRVPGDRGAAGRRDARGRGSPSPGASTAGSGQRSDGRREWPRGRGVRPRGHAAARAERGAARDRRLVAAPLARAEPARRARAGGGDRRADRGRDRGPRRLLLRRDEQAGDGPRARQRGRGLRREHHVRRGDRGRQRVAVGGRDRPRRPRS